ncbi:MAG: hypothetical protein KC457_30580, partial [Myxococcales bacterium]|nr:hypothetical protein [Myxococcales bacterium]
SAEAETVHPFKVPDAVHELRFELTAKVRSIAGQREVDLRAQGMTRINEIDRGGEIAGLHLASTRAGYVLSALGKSGEARAGLQVNLSLTHADFRAQMRVVLQTDARGRVELGALGEITTIDASLGDGGSARWVLPRPGLRLPQRIHGAAELELRLPASEAVLANQGVASLLERRGRGYLRSCLDAVVVEDGSLCLRGLEPGDYELVLEAGAQPIHIAVGPAIVSAGWSLSPRRQLQLRRPDALRIQSLELDGERLRIHLGGAGPRTRIHLFAARFLGHDPRAALELPLTGLSAGGFLASRCLYLSGRDIGDEYRYILERRRARVFAGNMAERPSVLLNPWALRSTSTGVEHAKGGADYDSLSEGGYAAGAAAPEPAPQGGGAGGQSSNLDFLPQPAMVALNLRPDDDGVLELDVDLGAYGHLEVVAVDGDAAVSRRLLLPEPALDPRDLRLSEGLDPAGHVVRRKRHHCLVAGARLDIDDPATIKLEVVDTVAKAHGLLLARSNDATLREFEFLTRWPSLAVDEQRRLYSKYACHELHLFLARKDPAFFAAVIRPYLANKL